VLGREGELAWLFRDDPLVARRHARVYLVGDRCVQVADLDSANGTFVNGEVIRSLTSLADQDVLRIGSIDLRLDSRWASAIGAGRAATDEPSGGELPPDGTPGDVPTRNAGDVTPTSIAEQHERYDAFISYSHAADGSLAPALQHRLQTLAKPLYQRKALRVFRDQTNLAATPELWSTIEEALAASRFFILLASPAAAGSPWVQQELDWWHRHRAPERLLIGVTHGTIAWDPVARDFDWHITDALPRSLSRWFRAEPLWVDLRWASSRSVLSHRDPRLQEDLATLAAPLRGMSKDDLIGRDLKQHHKVVRLTVAALTLLLVLAVAAGIGAWVAIQQRNTAQHQTALAESRALASAALSTAPTQLDLALLLAERSVQMNPTPGALASLFSAVSASPHLVQFVPERSPVTTLIAQPGGGMIVGDTQGTVSLLDTAHARQQPLPTAGGGAVTALADSGSGKIVVSGDAGGTVRLWSLSSRTLRWQRALGSSVQAIAVSPGASTIAVVLHDDKLVGLDAMNGRVRDRISLGNAYFGQYQDQVGFLQKDIVLVGNDVGATQVWRMAPQPRRLSESGQQAPGDRAVPAAWSSDGRTYVDAVGGTATVIQAATGRAHGSFGLLPATTTALAIDNSTDRLAYISNGLLAVQDRSAAASTAGRTSIRLPGFANAQQIAFSADGRWLIAGGGDTVAIFDLRQRSRLATELPTEVAPLACQTCFASATADPRGSLVVWTDGANIVCYDVRHARQRRYRNANPYSQGEVAFTPDGSTLLSYTNAGTVSHTYAPISYVGIWPTSAGCPSTVRWVRIDNYSPGQLLPVDRNRVVITQQYPGRIGLLDLRRKKIVRTYPLPKGTMLSSAAVSSDGRSIAVSLTTGKVIWFDINSGAVIGTNGSQSRAGGSITFLPGSQDVAQTTLTAIVLWNPRHGQVARFDSSGSVQKLAFSHNGQLLFALDNQDNLRIWDTVSQTLIGSLQALPLINDNGVPVAGGGEYGVRTSMALDDHDNLWLAAPSAHPTRWTLSPPTWSKLACTWADRTLTDREWRQYVATAPPTDLACPY
jgi:WD40 repeat protein